MSLRSNALTIAVAGFAAVGGLFAVSASSHEPSMIQSATADAMPQGVAADMTFKIVAADVMSPMRSAGPLTGDGSN